MSTEISWRPEKTQLIGDLAYLRRLLDQDSERFFKVATLQRTARCLLPGGNDSIDIKSILLLAVNQLGTNRWAAAAASLYGLTNDTQGKSLATRRQIASEIAGRNIETFRTSDEKKILNDLAEALITLVEQRANSDDNSHSKELLSDGLYKITSGSHIDTHNWLCIVVEAYVAEDPLVPSCGRVFAIGPEHTFADLAKAIIAAFLVSEDIVDHKFYMTKQLYYVCNREAQPPDLASEIEDYSERKVCDLIDPNDTFLYYSRSSNGVRRSCRCAAIGRPVLKRDDVMDQSRPHLIWSWGREKVDAYTLRYTVQGGEIDYFPKRG
jgi:hypothetical protein